MRNILADMPFFVEVARRGSFTRAADALDIPLPTLSRRIAAMERELGAQLLRRTTRSVELTDEGEAFFKRCECIVAEAENAREGLLRDKLNPAGRIRISIPASGYFLYLHGMLCPFTEKYPEIELHVHLDTRWVHLAAEPFDLELRVGSLPDSSLKVRKLATLQLGVYAAPPLLEGYPAPEVPRDLRAMPYISHPAMSGHSLTLVSETGKETVMLPPPRHAANSAGVALEFILAGQVAGLLHMSVAAKHEAGGRLVRLLPDWRTQGLDISLVMPPGSLPHRVRLFIDYLVDLFAELTRKL